MSVLSALSVDAVAAYQEMEESGVDPLTKEAPILAAFRDEDGSQGFRQELDKVGHIFGESEIEPLAGSELRNRYAVLAPVVTFGLLLKAQRYVDAHAFCRAVAPLLGDVREGMRVVGVDATGKGVTLALANGERVVGDSLVWAAGAWTQYFSRRLGIKVPLMAGRGYSFQVATPSEVASPVYFPVERLACTPRGDGLRIGGTMELAGPEDALDPRRIDAMVGVASELFTGIDLSDRRESWVGPRPVTADGLPLIGRANLDNVWVASGHGMWGVTHGPITGKLVAKALMEGVVDERLGALDPLRDR